MPSPRRFLLYLIFALTIPAATITLSQGSSALWSAELRLYNARMEAEPRPADPKIVIVDIDDLSLQQEGVWPWPRRKHAALIDRLSSFGPKAIGMDILFTEPSGSPEDDRMLAEAIARSGKVVLAALTSSEVQEFENGELRPALIKPLESLKATYGFAQFMVDPDQYVRRAPALGDGSFASALLEKAEPARLSEWLQMDHERLIRFAGPPQSYRTVSYSLLMSDVLDPKVDKALHRDGVGSYAELFKDAVVLVGTSDVSLHDLFATPFTTGDRMMPGVEIHANLIGSLRRGDALRESPELSMALTLGLSFLAAAGLALLPVMPGTILAAGLAAAYAVANLVAFHLNLWLWLLPPLIALGMVVAAIVGVRMLSEEREKRRIRATFARYVSPRIVDQVLKHPERYQVPSAERRYVTVLFSDVEGFTTISSEHPPELVAKHLNRYLSEMTACILEQEATLDKYMGDGIMAVWGNLGQSDPETDALRAVQAAIDMQHVAERLSTEWLQDGLPALRMRVGIHSGEGLVGNFGSSLKMDFTVIGDVVNTAARLEGLNKDYGSSILISGETASRLGGRFPLRSRGRGAVRGKTHQLDLFEVPVDPLLQKGISHA